MESTSGEGPTVPLLVDALDSFMSELISEAQRHQHATESTTVAPAQRVIEHGMDRAKRDTAYRLSLLIDQYRKGKLA